MTYLLFWDSWLKEVLIVAYIFISYSEEWLQLTLWLYDDLYPKMDMLLLIGLHKPSSYQNEIKVYRFFYTKQTIGFRLSWRHTYIVHPKSNVNFDLFSLFIYIIIYAVLQLLGTDDKPKCRPLNNFWHKILLKLWQNIRSKSDQEVDKA